MLYFDFKVNSEDEKLLLSLDEKIRNESINQLLRSEASKKNKLIIDPVKVGTFIHGVRLYKRDGSMSKKLESIIDNGLLCPEGVSPVGEDGEVFYHLSGFDSHINGINNLQTFLNNPSNVYSERISFLLPSFYHPNIERMSIICNNIKSIHPSKFDELENYEFKRFIISSPLKYNENQLNHVAVLGGIPSTKIEGLIISEKVNSEKIINSLKDKKLYVPVFNANGSKIY